MIDTTTILRTPAGSPARCKLRAAVVKNSVAACCSGEGPVAVSTTHSTPSRASARPSPVITSTPLEREIRTTSWPRASSTSTTWRPTLPVAPATATFRRSWLTISSLHYRANLDRAAQPSGWNACGELDRVRQAGPTIPGGWGWRGGLVDQQHVLHRLTPFRNEAAPGRVAALR